MAEAIGLASGLLALAVFASRSTITLYETVHSFRNHPKRVRDLEEELEALMAVLRSLTDTAGESTDADLSALNLPLLRCGNACKEFEQEIVRCSARSASNRTSFRDWAKLSYMGGNIDGFRQLVASYKSTITIALADANLRKSNITAARLKEYEILIKTATDDLEAHLQNIDEKLETIFERNTTHSSTDTTELDQMREERLSTQAGLEICAQLSEHISQIQLKATGSNNTYTLPERVTHDGLQGCRTSLEVATAKLEKHMSDLLDRMTTISRASMTGEEVSHLEMLKDELATARECKNICSKAELHMMENISVIDNYATGDETVQYLVSTDGTIIHGKNRGYGWRTRQLGGHVSDLSLQQLSRDISRISTPDNKKDSQPPNVNIPSNPNHATETGPTSEFGDRYGPGFKLPPGSSNDIQTPEGEVETIPGRSSKFELPPKRTS